jgi:hypothetical protein
MNIYSIGCSFTEGQGLENFQIENYTRLLSDKTKIYSYNLGSSGASNDYVFKKVFEILNNGVTKDDILIIQWTHYIRLELPRKYDNNDFFFYLPNTTVPVPDKIIKPINERGIYVNKVVNSNFNYKNMDSTIKHLSELHASDFRKFIGYFLNENYQINKTKNYIKSLYAYLELNGYKHLHFFGWDNCTIADNEILNYEKFLNTTFGGYTNTIGNEHPNKLGHYEWSSFLLTKLEELKYIKPQII